MSLLTGNSKSSQANKSFPTPIFFTQEDTSQVESVNKAKLQFVESENKVFKVQITDLQMSLDINKGIICDLLQCKSVS